jgi:ribosomal protein S18 acetylase RimI-like enzyme
MTDPIVRPMTAEDRAAVMELLADSDPWKRLGYQASDWDSYFTPLPQGRDSYVVDQNGRVGDYVELLGVGDWARGKGLGGRLLAHVEAAVFARAKNLFACVSDFNDQARHFYKKQGYQEIGPMPNFLIPGSAEILLRKTSGPARK